MYRMLIICLVGLIGAGSVTPEPSSGAGEARYRIETIAENLGVPWGMSFVAADELIVTDRGGGVRLVHLKTGTVRLLGGAPEVRAAGQGGMLDVAVTPGYRPGDWIYFTYVKEREGRGVTTLGRARLNGAHLDQWTELLETVSATDTSRHFGSRIAFDGDGHLYFSVGDRGVRENGQDLSSHAGSVLRLNLDGSVPADNPFVGRDGALPEIWSYGHRNIQGIAYDFDNRRLWAIEHGPRGGDEINLILPGRNYGWPLVSYGMEYWGPVKVGEGERREGVEDPVKVYIPSIAPGSLIFYTGAAFPDWRGNLIAGALVLRHINRVTLDGEGRAVAEERLAESLRERIRALAVGADGIIYFSTDSGMIGRIIPAD